MRTRARPTGSERTRSVSSIWCGRRSVPSRYGRSYVPTRPISPGIEHELVIVLNGARSDADGSSAHGNGALSREDLLTELDRGRAPSDRARPAGARPYGLWSGRARVAPSASVLPELLQRRPRRRLAGDTRASARSIHVPVWSVPPPAGRASLAGFAAGPATGPTSSPICAPRGATTRAFPTRTSAPRRSWSNARTSSR